ncbi:phosphoribosylanthranilate isomerase [Thauera sp. CAU 1555]|uniref:N-(5'-phosphoribosyl)anthranilate isomerase n=1 Tax=Thauera sedimentorum TaxID=2767595 RepID=A0ABR9B9W8_9RHOO|nr:phosphoribosylanthranilate isomerase [Thauera sedimentorum]MBC9072210.1 phosphoribosylanthranilate isomerase [Thauera sedimentorum]MBD8503129.1 phosphoribosylanthranilate isomerase [Thauera sedimentorum]
MSRTRIKICGLTRPDDVRAAVDAGADAIGLVFYPPSPRHVELAQAATLAALIPPFVTTVGLFVNADEAQVRRVLDAVPLQLLQFHGDESEAECARFGRPWIKAARMRPGVDLLEFAACHPGARGILVDAFVDGYGGGGKVFDWSLIPDGFDRPLVLSGGLTPDNVSEAVRRVRPWAVDVSSGVESAKGIKDARLITAFIAGVRNADG